MNSDSVFGMHCQVLRIPFFSRKKNVCLHVGMIKDNLKRNKLLLGIREKISFC